LSKNKLIKSKVFYKNKFLPKSKLNFSENLLSKNNKDKAVTFISENGFREERNWKQLNNNVSRIVNFFKKIKLNKNDRIAAYMPNCIETVEVFLATTAIGTIWSSCSPDFGINGAVERFSQIKPKILFITDRKKDIIITAGGKNVAPQNIENLLKTSPYISLALVYGDKKPYLTALITLDEDEIAKFAKDNRIMYQDLSDLTKKQKVIDLIKTGYFAKRSTKV